MLNVQLFIIDDSRIYKHFATITFFTLNMYFEVLIMEYKQKESHSTFLNVILKHQYY